MILEIEVPPELVSHDDPPCRVTQIAIALTTGAQCELAHRDEPDMAFEHTCMRREAEEDWGR